MLRFIAIRLAQAIPFLLVVATLFLFRLWRYWAAFATILRP